MRGRMGKGRRASCGRGGERERLGVAQVKVLFETVLALQPRVSAGGGASREDLIDQTAATMLERVGRGWGGEGKGGERSQTEWVGWVGSGRE